MSRIIRKTYGLLNCYLAISQGIHFTNMGVSLDREKVE